MRSPQQQVQEYLIATIGVEAAKRMVIEWKQLGVDMKDGNVIRQLSEHPELMETMGMLSNLGFLAKILYVRDMALK